MKNILLILLALPLIVFGQGQPIEYQLSEGWNMVGYTGCEITPIDEAFQDALGYGASLEETFQIIKDVRGIFWHPELGENSSLTHLTPGEGYMMYVKPGQATTVSFSEDYCNDITYQLNSGWNIVAYTGDVDADNNIYSSIDNALGNGAGIANTFQIIKNVSGQFWHELYTGLSPFTPGEAYYMYVNEGQETTVSFTENSTQVFENNPGVGFTLPTTDNNMSVVFPAGTLNDFIGGSLQAYVYGAPVSETFIIQEDGSAGISVIGNDGFITDYLADVGDIVDFAILMNGEMIVIDVNPPVDYNSNYVKLLDDNEFTFSIDGAEVVFGCTDDVYLEFYASANLDDGSCTTIRIDGCTDSEACNYYSEANIDDGSCLYLDYEQSLFNACCLGNSITTICLLDEDICGETDIECITYGCTQLWADNYDSFITENDGSCYRMGCTSPWADNYDDVATSNDGSCFRYGCTFDWANNYDVLATADDASCYRFGCTFDWADNYDNLATADDDSCYRFGCTFDWADNYDVLATDFDESCLRLGCTSDLAVNFDEYATIDNSNCEFDIITNLNISFDAWNITIDLQAGWNMFGYGCPTPIDVAEGLYNHTESILLVKDNNGLAYLPEFGFNGIGDFSPGYGYQIKLSQSIEGFSLCDWYVNDIPGDNIVSMLEENAALQAELDSILGFTEIIEGCTDSLAFNYNSLANIEDNSCNAIFYGCTDTIADNFSQEANTDDNFCIYNGCVDSIACNYTVIANTDDDSCEYQEEGFDCDGNITADIGDEVFGGIVFYIDETGEHGLVAATEDLGSYEWGCYGTVIAGADGQAIGTGYQNTLDIVAGCSETPIAASEALAYESEGHSDWYLPSRNELVEMYNTVGNGGPEGNIGGFSNNWYLSSSESINNHAWFVDFYDGNSSYYYKYSTYGVRIIRAF